VEQDAQGFQAVAAGGLGVPVGGFFAGHAGDAGGGVDDSVEASEWFDGA
jgi:hypothetical protein